MTTTNDRTKDLGKLGLRLARPSDASFIATIACNVFPDRFEGELAEKYAQKAIERNELSATSALTKVFILTACRLATGYAIVRTRKNVGGQIIFEFEEVGSAHRDYSQEIGKAVVRRSIIKLVADIKKHNPIPSSNGKMLRKISRVTFRSWAKHSSLTTEVQEEKSIFALLNFELDEGMRRNIQNTLLVQVSKTILLD